MTEKDNIQEEKVKEVRKIKFMTRSKNGTPIRITKAGEKNRRERRFADRIARSSDVTTNTKTKGKLAKGRFSNKGLFTRED